MMHSHISGFPELLPNEQIAFNKAIEIIKREIELYGFTPLDTPAVEKISTLLSKGNDHEIYGIYRLADESQNKGGELALRFDLTVPLARYISQHYGNLTFPYRRYHLGAVWRGERPQVGRYRQLYQFDIDIIGMDELSLLYDAEIIAIIGKVLQALSLNDVTIKINNRKIIIGLLEHFGVSTQQIPDIIRVIDKIHKIDREQFLKELSSFTFGNSSLGELCELLYKKCSNDEWLEILTSLSNNNTLHQGLLEIRTILEHIKIFDLRGEIIIDPTLARGLNYYTGIIVECIWLKYPELGSICGGGRYDNLAENFGKQKLPGIGISFGISRLLIKMIKEKMLDTNKDTTAKVLVTVQNTDLIHEYIKIANILRHHKINTELYMQNKSLATQMKYASKKGFEYVIIMSTLEHEKNQVILRNMQDSTQLTDSIHNIVYLMQMNN